jgi:hypothetical protein
MRIHIAKPLFAWDCLEDSPSLRSIRAFLEAIPDEKLLAGLRTARGKGRDDYPIEVLWGVLLLTIALRHVHFEACLAELRRNAPLRHLIGIDEEDHVPHDWNLSRFMHLLGQQPHRDQVREVFNALIRPLGAVVDDLGQNTAGDSSALKARRTRQTKEVEATVETRDEYGLPLACGGRKEYTDADGKVTHTVEWFGYKVHLLVDVKHEVILAWEVTSPKTSDNAMIAPLLEQAEANLPEGRIETLAYDKAADDIKVHRLLDQHDIQPVIQVRSQWQNQTEQLVPGQEYRGNIVYAEDGTVSCYDTTSSPPVKHAMAYTGHEPSRGTIKYRCPAQHQGWECPMSDVCNAGKTYGLTVRVKQDVDLRRFPAIPRATKKFERLYKGRTAVERVNARMKIFWGADDGNIVGSTRFYAFLGTIMIVHAAFATLLASAPRHEGRLGQTKLGPIAKALRELMAA